MLGSGGVARDYLIGAEDVNEAAATMSAQKQEDLRRDASTDADKLRERLADIVKCSLDGKAENTA